MKRSPKRVRVSVTTVLGTGSWTLVLSLVTGYIIANVFDWSIMRIRTQTTTCNRGS